MLKGGRCVGPKCAVDRRNKTPGQTAGGRRRRVSDRAVQLREKQKARYTYGMMERQFHRFFTVAEKSAGITGDNLILLLERRLDNMVYRLGFADSRSQARQLVLHGHILLNGAKTNISSALVKEGDTISPSPRAMKTEYFKILTENIKSKMVPNWLALDREKLMGKLISLPIVSDVETKFEGKTIVEFYSR
jgi:small subunit ribosomal protein S4